MKVSKEVMKTRAFERSPRTLQGIRQDARSLFGAKKSRAQRGRGGPDTESAIKCFARCSWVYRALLSHGYFIRPRARIR